VCEALRVFLNFTGRWDESLALYKASESKALSARDFISAGSRAYSAGRVHYLRNEIFEVLGHAERAARHWQRAGAGPHELGSAIRLQGLGFQLKKDYPAAANAFRESLEIFHAQSPGSLDVAIALNSLGGAERASGDLLGAERDFRKALEVAEALHNLEGVAAVTGNLAELALDRNDLYTAERLAKDALCLAIQLRRRELIAANCHYLSRCYLMPGKRAEGLSYSKHALKLFERLRMPNEIEASKAIVCALEGMQ